MICAEFLIHAPCLFHMHERSHACLKATVVLLVRTHQLVPDHKILCVVCFGIPVVHFMRGHGIVKPKDIKLKVTASVVQHCHGRVQDEVNAQRNNMDSAHHAYELQGHEQATQPHQLLQRVLVARVKITPHRQILAVVVFVNVRVQ